MSNLPWYETYRTGRRLGSLFLVGGIVVAIFNGYKYQVSPGLFCGIAGALGGLYLYTKSYMKDPEYRSAIITDFYLKSFRESINQYGWNVILELISIEELQKKVKQDVGDRPSLERIFDILGNDIARNCIRYNLLDRDQMRNLYTKMIERIGFDSFCKKYDRWWLDDGIVTVEEIQHHFKSYLHTVTDIIHFFNTYMVWPFERYRSRLNIDSHQEAFLIQLNNTYSISLKNYESRKKQIRNEHLNTVYTYTQELTTVQSETTQTNYTRMRIQELQRTISLAENKYNESVTGLKANWRELKRQIRANWINYKSGGGHQVVINTSFASSTEILPVQQNVPVNVVVHNTVQTQQLQQQQQDQSRQYPMPVPSAPYI